jgi:hypothetical protein
MTSVIEIDRKSHENKVQKDYDKERTFFSKAKVPWNLDFKMKI